MVSGASDHDVDERALFSRIGEACPFYMRGFPRKRTSLTTYLTVVLANLYGDYRKPDFRRQPRLRTPPEGGPVVNNGPGG